MPNQIHLKNQKSKMPPKNWRGRPRVKTYQAPPESRWRRILRFFINPITIFGSLFVLLGVFLTLTYFWFEYSDKVDLLLKGEVFTHSAGIYSAPKTLREGEAITPENLINYLKSAGYIEKNRQADAARSRYETVDGKIEIEPGETGEIDGKKIFPALEVEFKKDGKSIAAITDKDKNEKTKQAQIEPKILSSVAAEGDGRRKVVTFADLPPHLVKAITVTEDRAFFEHYGVNFRGIARALWRRYEKDEDNSPLANQGGSSITQQLVKNLLLTNDPTIERKVKEAYMSLILETRLTKQKIFELYANQIYLGQLNGVAIYGVGEASNAYFGKDVTALTLPEAAFLAGIIRSPNRYNPFKNQQRVTERRNQVLDSMREAGEITGEQFEQAKQTTLDLKRLSNGKELEGMPYFSQFAVEELPKVASDPEILQHSRVYTTIDPDLQKAAYEIVNKRLEKLDKYFPKKKPGNLQAALVAIRPKTGEIVAMVGGRDFLATQFNRATSAQRQPGSVFKPFVYAAAINSAYEPNSRTITAATIFKDEKKVFTFGNDSYAPNNYGDTFSNKELTLRDALVKSKNTITVDLGMELNIGKVMNLAYKAGLPKVDKAYPSMALGTAEATPLQVAAGYTMFANLGEAVKPLAINRITDGNGKTLTQPTAERKKVLQPDVAYIMDDIMKDVINRGTAAEAKAWGFKNVDGKTAFAGKTGTSRDGWFAGFTPEIVCVVYVGFDDNDDLGMKGSDSAMPIWADFMREALNLHPEWNGDWQMPATVRKGEIDLRNGSLIRELTDAEADTIKIQQKIVKDNAANSNTSLPTYDEDGNAVEPPKEIYVTEVPAEFRRVEMFVTGTVPNKTLLSAGEMEIPDNLAQPSPTGTPFTTWQEQNQNTNQNLTAPNDIPPVEMQMNITIMVCPLTGMRATINCPNKQAKTFKEGEEPKDFCSFHVNQPK